ncbi:MAG: hypothetical protein KGP29_07340 [Proteobacteria bacterium]|nr:hypothetical protein [Pseudomonadota bacterium]
MINKTLLVALLFFSLVSCKIFTIPGKVAFLPFTNFKVPPGTPAFQAGYKDGCSGVIYARGNVFYRSRYDYRYDPEMIGNAEYKFGYSKGWGWCFYNVVGVGQSAPNKSADRFLSPYGTRPTFDTSPNTVDNAWGGFFGGLSSPIDGNSTPGGLDGSYDILQKGISGGSAGSGQSAFGNPLWSGETSPGFMGIW